MEARKHQIFKTLEEVNENFDTIVKNIKLTKSQRDILWVLFKHSAKVPGVSWLKNQSIADKIGLKKDTVKKNIKKLVEMKIIKRIQGFRPVTGGYGACYTIFLPYEIPHEIHLEDHPRNEEEIPCVAKDETKNNSRETIYFKHSFKRSLLHKRKSNHKKVSKLDASYTASYVPEEFVSIVSSYYDDAEIIEDFWKSVYFHTKKLKQITERTITDTAIKAFKQSIRAHKLSKITKKLVMYFTGVFKNMIHDIVNPKEQPENEKSVVVEPKKPIREEKTPDWLKEEEEKRAAAVSVKTQETTPKNVDENKEALSAKQKMMDALKKMKPASKTAALA
ncbi:helix-turn-helix domain-containing protein [Bacillus amyloliquefaciens]|uniref:helix-turn-helix domain-containing protein n=1 Tax=Bacillus amyloliquefaciens TaxID=1390 RepID=UPI002809ABC4|nr:helix-turn-helix domain-containing protein [Bacillus amyloliquefaciens]MDQ8094889.1 helix-turn-helix domain-containing protein [Bacillus amyloliquefaciens]